MTNLKEKHGSTYTGLHYQIRVELTDGELAHLTEPPENSMFTRAGRGGTTTQKRYEVAEAISKVAKQFSCTFNLTSRYIYYALMFLTIIATYIDSWKSHSNIISLKVSTNT